VVFFLPSKKNFMKNLFLLCVFLFTCAVGRSQQFPDLRMRAKTTPVAAPSIARNSHAQIQSVNSFYIDYDAADASLYGSNYQRFVWPMNNYYQPSDSAMRYCIVAFDSLYDLPADTGYATDSISSLAIDSIFLMLGQENNSGNADTLIVRIIGVDSTHGYPKPSIVYWSDMIIIPSGSPLSGDWRTPVSVKMIPYLSLYTSSQFAIMVEYYGSVNDTLGIVSGFGFRDTCGSLNQPADTTHFSSVRKQSSGDHFKANSFALWSQYSFIGILPTQNGSNIYFDCNTNGQYDGGQDGESFIQNIQFIAHVKTDAAGVNDYHSSDLSIKQNEPNPFTGSTSIPFVMNVNGDVTLLITDLTGRHIAAVREENLSAGTHRISFDASGLEPGIYFYTLTSGNSGVTRKMTVIN
jgi:hypothetical protein